jgi:tripartite-type tricarboxylate transporter receptor subunit TctC
VDMVHVPYKGGAPQMTALISGEVSLAFASLPSALGHVKAGRLQPLGVTGSHRSRSLPDVPAIAEFLQDYEVTQWYGVLAPAGTPKDIISRLHGEIAKAVKSQKVREQLTNFGFEGTSNTPDEFASMIQAEMEKWSKVVKAAGVPLE